MSRRYQAGNPLISFRVPRAVAREIKARARAQALSLSAVARTALLASLGPVDAEVHSDTLSEPIHTAPVIAPAYAPEYQGEGMAEAPKRLVEAGRKREGGRFSD